MAPAAVQQQPRWLRIASLAAYSFSFLVFGVEVNLLGPTAIDLAARAGVSEADLGCIFTINGLISIAGAAPSGWVTDHLPGHPLLAGSLLLQALGLSLIASRASLAGVAAAFAGVALTWNVLNTAGNVLALQQAPEGRAALVVNAINALFGAGALAAPLAAEAAARLAGTALAAYPACAALAAASGAVFLLLPSPPTPAALAAAAASDGSGDDGGANAPLLGGGEGEQQQQEEEGDRRQSSPARPGSSAGAGAGPGAGANPWALSGPLRGVLLPAAAFIFLSVGLEVAVGGWTTVYATRYIGLSEADGRALTSAYWLAFTLGRVAASLVAAATSPRALLLGSTPLAAAGSALALALPRGVLARAPGLAGAAVALVGLGLSCSFASLLALLGECAPVNGSATGLLGGCAGAGTMALPAAIALLAKATPLGYQGLMAVTLVAMLLQFACLAPVLAAAGRAKAARAGGGGGICDGSSISSGGGGGSGEGTVASGSGGGSGNHQRLRAEGSGGGETV